MNSGEKLFLFILIREAFDNINWSQEIYSSISHACVNSCIKLDLIEEAKEMISDAKEYGYDYTNLLK